MGDVVTGPWLGRMTEQEFLTWLQGLLSGAHRTVEVQVVDLQLDLVLVRGAPQ